MLLTGSIQIDAERAFDHTARRRRLASVTRRLLGRGTDPLPVFDGAAAGTTMPTRGLREIPLADIAGTLEPSRATQFDSSFRPAAIARDRWQRVWRAEHSGAVLPPISVVPVGDAYAVRDGHHRISVAMARGAVTIDAQVEAA